LQIGKFAFSVFSNGIMPSRKTFPIVYIAAYITLTFFAHPIITYITFVAKEEKIAYTLLRINPNHILEIANPK
jgi:hypothetical protein